jgi:putative ABC transport system permease protein
MVMPVLQRASFGYLTRHPWQLALALIGICVGVAVMVAVDLANESSRRAFLMSMDAVNGEATHQIVGGPAGVDEALYAELRVQYGLRNVAPVVEGYVHVGNVTLHLLGIDGLASMDLKLLSAAGAGFSSADLLRRMLTEPGAVVLSRQAAAAIGLAPDDSFTLQAGGKAFSAHVAALIGADDGEATVDVAVTDIANAQHWLGRPGRLSRIDVRVEGHPGSVTQIELIEAALPPEALLLTADSRSQALSEMSDAFMTNLTAMSLLALLIGIFLIYNSVAFAVLQRRSLFGVLRALGLTRPQLVRLVLGEALVLGIVGALLGLAAGAWLGQQLLVLVSQSINDLYYVVNVTDIAVNPRSMIRGFVAGLGATLIAAAVPALEAASSQPRLALARSVIERRSGWISGKAAIAGLATVVLGIVLLRVSGTGLVAGLIAVFMLLLGLALCVPVAVRAIARLAAPVASRLGGIGLRLAVSGVAASLSRTGVAIVALAVAVSATVGVSIMVDSFRGSVSDWLDNTLRSDIYVGVAHGTLDPDLVEDLLRLPGVADHSASRRVWIESSEGRTRLTAIRMARESYPGVTLEDGDRDEVWHAFDNEAAVLVSASYAYRHNVGSGDVVSLRTPDGERNFHIAGTYRSYDADLDAVLMSRRTYTEAWQDPAVESLGIYVAEGASPEDVIHDIRRLSSGRQALLVSSNGQLRERSMQIFDRTFVITGVLYWLAVSVAATGILGAMLALQLERARELAVFRALGMTPLQLGRMVVWQTAFMGLLSGLAAIPLGLVMGWVLINVINRRAFGWQMDMSVSPTVLWTAVLLALVTATLAGLYPAWRAAQAKPALAMREE